MAMFVQIIYGKSFVVREKPKICGGMINFHTNRGTNRDNPTIVNYPIK
jgi:hypothetical protein